MTTLGEMRRSTARTVPPTPLEARAALDRVVASKQFDASDRNRRFLIYIVNESLAGRAERIKAYAVATAVFGRDEDFDPQLDPIIRIEAGRLRRSLERYYLTDGSNDPIKIVIPKGTYAPVFQRPENQSGDDAAQLVIADDDERARGPIAGRGRGPFVIAGLALVCAAILAIGTAYLALRDNVGAPESPAVEARRGPALFVVPFETDGNAAQNPAVAQGFARDIMVGLSRFKDLFVYAPGTSFRHPPDRDAHAVARDLNVDFLLSGAVAVSHDRFRATVSLTSARNGRHLWSERYDTALDPAEVLNVREKIADQVVQTIAPPHGVIFSDKLRETEGRPPQSFSSYECVLIFHLYWRKLAAERYGPVRECLERTVAREPDYAEAVAALSFMYIDAYRFRFDDGALGDAPLSRALALANRAIELAPKAAAGYKARHLTLWMMQDIPRSFEAARMALSLNPYDTDIMGDYGTRLCLTGDWSAGLPLVREAFARNPAESSAYRAPLALHHYLRGEFRAALDEAQRIDMPRIIYPHILRAISHAQLGQPKEASSEIARIAEIDPRYGDRIVADLEKRNIQSSIIRAVLAGLHKAGMTGSDLDALGEGD